MKRKKKNNHVYKGQAIKSLPNLIKSIYRLQSFKDKVDPNTRKETGLKLSEEHSESFKKGLDTIKELLKTQNPLILLTYFFWKDISINIKENVDKKMSKDFQQFHVELLQALILQEDKPSTKFIEPENVLKLKRLIIDTAFSFSLKRLKDLVLLDSDKDQNKFMILDSIRNNTMSIRNWAFPMQVFETVLNVAKDLDSRITDEKNRYFTQLILLFKKITELIETKLNFISKIEFYSLKEDSHEKILQKINSEFSFNHFSAEEIKELQTLYPDLINFKIFIRQYLSLFKSDCFIFDLEVMEKLCENKIDKSILQSILDKFSLTFGELKSHKSEFFFLANPIWDKPFIKLDNKTFFFPIPTLFFEKAFNWLEISLGNKQDLKTKYEKSRSNYLQKRTEEIFKEALKDAIIYSNVYWLDKNDKEYESDLIILFEKIIFIVELKSGRISNPARRGAFDRLENEVQKLIVDPAIQANRLKTVLNSTKEINFKIGKENILLDISKYDFIIPLSVSLDTFGLLISKYKQMKEIGMIPDEIEIDPCLAITELELVFDLLETIPEKIHYLLKRSLIYKYLLYSGDEIDLLVFYLETGFNNIKTKAEGMYIQLAGRSYELDNYYIDLAYNKKYNVQKPQPARTLFFDKILRSLEANKSAMWLQISLVLLNVTHTSQINIEKNLRILFSETKQKYFNKNRFQYFIFLNELDNNSELLLFIAYKELDRKEYKQIVDNIVLENLLEKRLTECIVMGFDLDVIKKVDNYTSLDFIKMQNKK